MPDLMNAPPTDRVILAVTNLQMEWEAAEKNFSDVMVENIAKRWSLSESDADDLTAFLCEFIMDLREGEDGDEGEDEDY